MSKLPVVETLKLALDRGVLHVTLDRPETKNALNRAMVRDLTAAVDYLAAHTDIRAAVVRGANATFCAGGDINGFKEMFSTPLPKAGERDGARRGARAGARRHRALLAERQRGHQAAAAGEPHDAARGIARAIGRRVRRLPAWRGRARGRHGVPGEAQAEMDESMSLAGQAV